MKRFIENYLCKMNFSTTTTEKVPVDDGSVLTLAPPSDEFRVGIRIFHLILECQFEKDDYYNI